MPDTILVIDDDVSIAAALLARLRAIGYDVNHAACGEAGLQHAAQQPPDLILLDIRMPGMDGFEVCRRLKADPELADIPVVFLSANVQESAQRQAIDAGGQAFLSKPYEASEVTATIARLLANKPRSGPSILLVDDDKRLVEALCVRFESLGYFCVTENTGTSALAVFREKHIDLVITDVNMPGGDGAWFARKLAEQSDVPVIIMTGMRERYADELNGVPYAALVEKPIDIERLVDLVRTHVAAVEQKRCA